MFSIQPQNDSAVLFTTNYELELFKSCKGTTPVALQSHDWSKCRHISSTVKKETWPHALKHGAQTPYTKEIKITNSHLFINKCSYLSR